MSVDMTVELDATIGRLIEKHKNAEGVVYLGPSGDGRPEVRWCVEDELAQELGAGGPDRSSARALLDRYIWERDHKPGPDGEFRFWEDALMDLGGGEYVIEAEARFQHVRRHMLVMEQEQERSTLLFFVRGLAYLAECLVGAAQRDEMLGERFAAELRALLDRERTLPDREE